ncbi:meiosis-specific protein MEI4 [Pungitius pungitius]|uniref:meiosis-specific protein MEI4 n=1 Tax=Pungitius pungitius TaxID=134920 RepID=UPI002E0F9560
MERNDCHLKAVAPARPPARAGRDEWFFTRAKVALALAVIKDRPPGASGRAHAEDLSRRLRARDGSWQQVARGLQQEVLRLQQELLLSRVTPRPQSGPRTPDLPGGDDASQDLFSLGGESHGRDSETPDLLPPASAPPRPPLPSGLPLTPRGEPSPPHARFLQSLCALQRVDHGARGLESLWFGPGGAWSSVLPDSVCQLLDSVMAACRAPPLLGLGGGVLPACRVAARATDLFCSQRGPPPEFRRRVEESLTELTALLLHSSQLSGLGYAEKLMECLVALGGSNMSKSFVIRHLLSLLDSLANQLWQLFQGEVGSAPDRFPVDQYQNSCYLFWVLEELLQSCDGPCRVEVCSELTEQRIFLLSQEFPLFSICWWRLRCLLTSSERSGSGPHQNLEGDPTRTKYL